ncbi:MAG: PQQ-binding-like beta-propeller repeat protein, partial [Acidothermus cellulolyticus]|nr:PQQ-binding-like beta-propeller repeat protein [Acidothermus cellulolyticus]
AVPVLPLCTAFGGAAAAGPFVYVPCTSGVHAVRISGSTMTPVWRAAPPGSPIVVAGTVLSTDRSGTLYGLDASTGAVRWRTGLGDSLTRFATPAAATDGYLYVGTEHGMLVIVATH